MLAVTAAKFAEVEHTAQADFRDRTEWHLQKAMVQGVCCSIRHPLGCQDAHQDGQQHPDIVAHLHCAAAYVVMLSINDAVLLPMLHSHSTDKAIAQAVKHHECFSGQMPNDSVGSSIKLPYILCAAKLALKAPRPAICEGKLRHIKETRHLQATGCKSEGSD